MKTKRSAVSVAPPSVAHHPRTRLAAILSRSFCTYFAQRVHGKLKGTDQRVGPPANQNASEKTYYLGPPEIINKRTDGRKNTTDVVPVNRRVSFRLCDFRTTPHKRVYSVVCACFFNVIFLLFTAGVVVYRFFFLTRRGRTTKKKNVRSQRPLIPYNTVSVGPNKSQGKRSSAR